MSDQQSTTSSFIDLHTVGMGYLSRVREIKPKKGAPFIAAAVSAFHGEKGQDTKMTYVKFDCRVSGTEAEAVVRSLMEAANDKDKKVVIGFRIGDFYIDTFQYVQGEKAGQQGTCLKGRLLKVNWANIDGKRTYTAPEKEAAKEEPVPA